MYRLIGSLGLVIVQALALCRVPIGNASAYGVFRPIVIVGLQALAQCRDCIGLADTVVRHFAHNNNLFVIQPIHTSISQSCTHSVSEINTFYHYAA